MNLNSVCLALSFCNKWEMDKDELLLYDGKQMHLRETGGVPYFITGDKYLSALSTNGEVQLTT